MGLALSAFVRIFIFRLKKHLLYKFNQFYLHGYSAHTVLIAMPTPPCTQWLASGASFPCVMKLTAHIYAVLRLRMIGDVLALPHKILYFPDYASSYNSSK
jgi:hypothetical protein